MKNEINEINFQDEYYRKLEAARNKSRKTNARVKVQRNSSLSFIFEVAKKRFKDENISLDEIIENTKVNRDLLEIIFSESIVDDISRIIQFANVKITLNNNWELKTHKIFEDDKSIKINRLIEPKCHIYYDKESEQFYNFHIPYKQKSKIKDKHHKAILVKDMCLFLEKHLNDK